MLGFSPLAGLPLGADEDALTADGSIRPRTIVAGVPVVATAALSSEHDFAPADVATAAPVLGLPVASSVTPFPVNGIVTGAPTIAGPVDTPGSIDAYARALQAQGLASFSSPLFQFSADGTKYFVKEGSAAGGPPSRYDLATPWDISTRTLVNASAFNLTTAYSVRDFQLSDDGSRIAFLMLRTVTNSLGRLESEFSLHLYSLAQPFVTNYTGTVSSDASASGYTFIRSVVLSSSTSSSNDIKAFRFFGGRLYTVQSTLDNTKIQRRDVTNSGFSSLGTSTNTTILAEISSTSSNGPSIAFLSLDGIDRIYHSNAVYDPLTLEQLEVSSQILGAGLRYQLKPGGVVILNPNLAEIDTDTSVTIQQEGASAVISLVAPAPILDTAAFGQDHVLTSGPLLTGAPVISAELSQEHALGSVSISTDAPAISASVLQDHLLPTAGINAATPEIGLGSLSQQHVFAAEAILASAPQISAELFQDHALLANEVIVSPPEMDAVVLQGHSLGAEAISTGPPLAAAVEAAQEHSLNASNVLASAFALDASELLQDHKIPGAESILTDAPVLSQASTGLIVSGAGFISISGASFGGNRVAGESVGETKAVGVASAFVRIKGSAQGEMPLGGFSAGAALVSGVTGSSFDFGGTSFCRVSTEGSLAGYFLASGGSIGSTQSQGDTSISFGLGGSGAGAVRLDAASSGEVPLGRSIRGLVQTGGHCEGGISLFGNSNGQITVRGILGSLMTFDGASQGGSLSKEGGSSGLIRISGVSAGQALIEAGAHSFFSIFVFSTAARVSPSRTVSIGRLAETNVSLNSGDEFLVSLVGGLPTYAPHSNGGASFATILKSEV